MDASQEISCELVIAGRNGAKVLDFIEEALNEVAFVVKREIAIPFDLPIGLWGNNGCDLALLERVYKRVRVKRLVCNQSVGGDTFNQWLGESEIMNLARAEDQVDRIAQGINQGVDFCSQPSARAADLLLAVFFRAPALC